MLHRLIGLPRFLPSPWPLSVTPPGVPLNHFHCLYHTPSSGPGRTSKVPLRRRLVDLDARRSVAEPGLRWAERITQRLREPLHTSASCVDLLDVPVDEHDMWRARRCQASSSQNMLIVQNMPAGHPERSRRLKSRRRTVCGQVDPFDAAGSVPMVHKILRVNARYTSQT